jgi:hypothetical protein
MRAENQLYVAGGRGLLVHVGIVAKDQPTAAESVLPIGVLMFQVQRLSEGLGSHAVGMRVALFAFGLELSRRAQSRPEDQGHEPVGAAINEPQGRPG